MEYINQNEGTLNNEQQGNITDHAWLAQTFTNFDVSEYPIGSNEWTEAALEIISEEYGIEWIYNPTPNTESNSAGSIEEVVDYFENSSDEGTAFASSMDETNQFVMSSSTPKGFLAVSFDLSEGFITNNNIYLNFKYEGFLNNGTPLLQEGDVEVLDVDWNEEIGITNPTVFFELTPDSAEASNTVGNPYDSNALTLHIHLVGKIKRGIKLTDKYDVTRKTNVALDFYLEATDGSTWTDLSNPRFLSTSRIRVIKYN